MLINCYYYDFSFCFEINFLNKNKKINTTRNQFNSVKHIQTKSPRWECDSEIVNDANITYKTSITLPHFYELMKHATQSRANFSFYLFKKIFFFYFILLLFFFFFGI